MYNRQAIATLKSIRAASISRLCRPNVPVPPVKMMFDGPGEQKTFIQNGRKYLRYFIQLCDLQPSEAILDVGSGIGRKAIPLTAYLNKDGRYEGIEIVEAGVNWCKENVQARHSNFHFQKIDVRNDHYNPEGTVPAKEYSFPFDDQSFDFVILTSVFTHMLSSEVTRYLYEVARVLKSTGRCLITYFLLNETSSGLMSHGNSDLNFWHSMDNHSKTVDEHDPGRAVAYSETFIMKLYESNNLRIRHPIHYGWWCGRKHVLRGSYQDIIVADRVREEM